MTESMMPKPEYLGPQYAAAFTDSSVVAAYPNRPPYPPEVIDFLVSLLVGEPRSVLDVGCGTGDVARPLARVVDRVYAVDISGPMLERARGLPGGDHPAITWVQGAVEEVPLPEACGLITAGEALHWMDWAIVMPRFADVLLPNGVLAIVGRDRDYSPVLEERMDPVIERFSTNRDLQLPDLTGELTSRGLFQPLGELRTDWAPWTPTADEYIEVLHSQSAFSRDRMEDAGAAFDREARAVLTELVREGTIEEHDGRLQLGVRAEVLFGRPLHPTA